MDWYLGVLKKYAVFDGRARRKEFWMFVLFNFIASAILGVLDSALDTSRILASIYSLAVLIPSIAVAIRRMHDINKSGAWILINLIPLIGEIWFIVLAAKAGDVGPNQYGQDPKEIIA